MEQEEKWVDISRFNNQFAISDAGRVRNNKTGRILKSNTVGSGYLAVSIKPDGRTGQCHCLRVHREVALHFLDCADVELQVNHKDGNKLNNAVDNLEFLSRSNNVKHAYDNKLIVRAKGEEVSFSVLTVELIDRVRREMIPGDRHYGLRALGRKYGFKHNTMSEALNSVNWKCLNS